MNGEGERERNRVKHEKLDLLGPLLPETDQSSGGGCRTAARTALKCGPDSCSGHSCATQVYLQLNPASGITGAGLPFLGFHYFHSSH